MTDSQGPLKSFDDWEDFVLERYPKAGPQTHKDKSEFRNYDDPARDTVREFYRLNHERQTLVFARAKREEYARLDKRRMGIWEAAEYLNTLVDDSDPDTDATQIQHLLQTSEAIRADGHPRWFVLAGFVHDLGKILCLYGEPQWAVVGDTFPLGCSFSDKIVYPQYFEANPDAAIPEYSSSLGVYEEGCGLDAVTMSWGHDEYMYLVAKDYLPEPALYMLRYHSFYAAHREGAYDRLMNARDREMFRWVKAFNPYDLYSKSPVLPDMNELRPYYEELVAEFFPDNLAW